MKIFNGALYGLGFTAVFLISVYLYTQALKEDISSDYPPELKDEYLSKIEIVPDKFYFTNGRVRVSGVVKNNTGVGLQQVNIVAKVKSNGAPLEKCTSLADGKISNGGETTFTIYCTTKWETINPEELSAEFEPFNVYIDVPRNENQSNT